MSISFSNAAFHNPFSIGAVGRSTPISDNSSVSASTTSKNTDQSLLSRFGTDGTGINREIRVNGKLIGLVFNSGGMALDNEYSEVGDLLGWSGSSSLDDEKDIYGPELADLRTSKLMAVLERATSGQIDSTEGAFLSTLKNSSFDISMAPTAMTQAEFENWMTTRSFTTGRYLDLSV